MVASLLPSSTTMISQLVATLGRIFTAASTVRLMLPSSLNAGKITDIVAHGLETFPRSRGNFMPQMVINKHSGRQTLSLAKLIDAQEKLSPQGILQRQASV